MDGTVYSTSNSTATHTEQAAQMLTLNQLRAEALAIKAERNRLVKMDSRFQSGMMSIVLHSAPDMSDVNETVDALMATFDQHETATSPEWDAFYARVEAYRAKAEEFNAPIRARQTEKRVAAEKAAIIASTCPECFTARSAAGTCMC